MCRLLTVVFTIIFASFASAQNTEIAFGGVSHNTNSPIDVTADGLSIDQNTGQAIFLGSVLITQGTLRLRADEVTVEYGTDHETTDITAMVATGNVVFVTAEDEARANQAIYDVENASIRMVGNVLLTQGPAVVSSEALSIDLDTGAATLSGSVKTTLQSNKAQQ